MSIQQAVQFTLGAEGGYTVDDGGPTMYGVTQAVYDAFRVRNSEPKQPVRLIQMDEVCDIMEGSYWGPAHCADLSPKMAVAHFDWAYNHGVDGAIRTLQEAAGCIVDGAYGQKTKASVQAAGGELLAEYLDARRKWYNDAATRNPQKYAQYLHGWLNRVNALEIYLKGVN